MEHQLIKHIVFETKQFSSGEFDVCIKGRILNNEEYQIQEMELYN